MANGSGSQAVASGLQGILQGFLSGYDLRRQRTADQQASEDRLRAQKREDMTWKQAQYDRSRTQAMQDLATTEQYGQVYDPSLLPENVGKVRAQVGQALTGTAPGFRRVGPSAAQREDTRVSGMRRAVGRYLTASPEDRQQMLQDPDVIAGLDEAGILDNMLPSGSRTTPYQRFEGAGGQYRFDPTEGTATPILGANGEQIAGARTAGDDQTVTQRTIIQSALSEIDDIYERASEPGGPTEADANRLANRTALRHGYKDVQELIQAARRFNVSSGVIGGDTAVDWQTRTEELRSQGLTEDEIIAKLREEGLIG